MSPEQPPDQDNAPDDQDQDEMSMQADPEPDRSLTFRASSWLVDNLLIVAGALGAGFFVLLFLLDAGIPRWLRVIGLVMSVTLPVVGKPTGRKVADMLWNPTHVWLVDVDARHLDAGIFRVPAQRFRQWDVTDGSLDWVSSHLAFGKNADLEAMTVEGTWRGTMSDRELMRSLQAVDECRSQLEDDAKRGFAIEAQAFTIVRRACRDAVLHVVSTFEEGTLPDEGDELTAKIDTAVDQFGLERKIRHTEDDQNPTSDVPGVEDPLAEVGDDLDDGPLANEVSADD